MPVKVVPHLLPRPVNGVGSFMLQCRKITLRYCNWGGSSKGMRQFLTNDLKKFAAANPKIQFEVLKQSGHPVVRGEYTTGNDKTVCVRNYEPAKILEKLQLLADSSGTRLKKYTNAVESPNASVRGIWSPFHVGENFRYRV